MRRKSRDQTRSSSGITAETVLSVSIGWSTYTSYMTGAMTLFMFSCVSCKLSVCGLCTDLEQRVNSFWFMMSNVIATHYDDAADWLPRSCHCVIVAKLSLLPLRHVSTTQTVFSRTVFTSNYKFIFHHPLLQALTIRDPRQDRHSWDDATMTRPPTFAHRMHV